MSVWLWIAAGGAIGAMLRHGTNLLADRFLGKGFPFGTLLVNVIGCLVMGMLWQWLASYDAENRPAPAWLPMVRSGIATGLLGALTTFSTFGLQTMLIVQQEDYLSAAGNVAANVLLSLLAVFLGAALVRGAL